MSASPSVRQCGVLRNILFQLLSDQPVQIRSNDDITKSNIAAIKVIFYQTACPIQMKFYLGRRGIIGVQICPNSDAGFHGGHLES